MRYTRSCIILGLVLVFGAAPAAPPQVGREPAKGTEDAPGGTAADLSFADGSTVRIVLISEAVELETKYGKLTIPAADIQRIEFAFRLPNDVARKIDADVKRLGDNSFEEREAATKQLRAVGTRAYPALEAATKHADAEVRRRAAALIAEIREKASDEDLHFTKKDRVVTSEFTVTGRITTSTLRGKTAYFGEADLRLTDLRVFQAAGGGHDQRLVIDAARYGSAPNQWMETSITLERGSPLRVSASGQVDLWPAEAGQYMTTPKGYGNARPPQFSGGGLIGKVGENGAPFLIGEKYEGKANGSGKLYLHIFPSPWGNPSTGTYEVKVGTGER